LLKDFTVEELLLSVEAIIQDFTPDVEAEGITLIMASVTSLFSR